MNVKEMRTSSEKDLREELSKLLQEQFSLRMQKGTGQLAQPNELRRVRREIARVRTVLNEMSKEGIEA